MLERWGNDGRGWDLPFALALGIVLVLLPAPAWAVQVGCFVTAVLLGAMLFVGLGLTLVFKYLLSRYVATMLATPWKRIVVVTVAELFLLVIALAVVGVNILVTILAYLPVAFLLNRAVLDPVLAHTAAPVPQRRRMFLFALEAFSLPTAIMISGVLWFAVTNFINFADLNM